MAAQPTPPTDFDQLAVNVVRGLSMDAVQKANSGHPGTAMALAPLAHVLFSRVLRYDAATPEWFDRDRLVLSAGHASILLYSYLFLTGTGGLELDDIRAFRQWGSRTPGHPEQGHTAGVEVTTGPLGQGIANAVGMAMAEANLRARFGEDLCSHHVFAIVGDGDLMEGISHEAASLAGHLGLGRLVVVYDDNHITIDGPTDLAYSEDASMRFRSYGWDVDDIGDVANDLDALEAAIRRGMSVTDRPTLIRLRSHIGWPSPSKTDTSAAHGSPLGADEIAKVREILGMPQEDFWVPADVLAHYRAIGARGAVLVDAWADRMEAAGDRGRALHAALAGELPAGWHDVLPTWEAGASVATRVASGECLNALVPVLPSLIGGGADLTGNTGTQIKGAGVFSAASPEGRLVHFGVREHAMGAVMNGMAAHGGLLPVGGTFFVFSDYMRGAVRVAALSGSRVIYSWTHDSIGVGEDGPTHQPVEHLASFRAMPGLSVVRPADANETAAAWRLAVEEEGGPIALVLSRQNLPVLEGTAELAFDGVVAGGYVLREAEAGDPDIVLVGTGSEVQLCVRAAELLERDGVRTQVVSLPSFDRFAATIEDDPDLYEEVFPPEVPVLAVEMGSSFGWGVWADDVLALDRFGASAPADVLMRNLEFTPEKVVERAMGLLEMFSEDA